MLPARVSVLALMVPLLMLASQVSAVRHIRVEAANRNLDDLITFFGEGRYLVLANDEEMEEGSISDIGYRRQFTFEAASDTLDYKHSRKYGSDFYTDNYWGKTTLHHYTAAENTFYNNQGPDAVAECKENMFYFKGCNVVTAKGWSDPQPVSQYGLPCEPDAAWKEINGNGMIVLKGDQIWIWDCQGRATKMPFSSKYTITSWVLKP